MSKKGKVGMKIVVVVFCGILGVADSVYGARHAIPYTAETGYVTLEGNDSGNGTNSSFHSAKNWSDKEAPHAGTNYFVKAGKTLDLDWVLRGETPAGFVGDSIVVGGRVRMSGYWGTAAICGPLTMLPGSVFHWVNLGNIVDGSVHVKGSGTSAVKPVVFKSGRHNESKLYVVSALMRFTSDPDGMLTWELDEREQSGVVFIVQEDWTSFLGTFRIGRCFTFRTQNGQYRMPGHVIIASGAMLELGSATGQSEIGSLTVCSGGVLNLSALNGGQTVKISKKLELEPGAIVIPRSFGGEIKAEDFHPVFELTAEAVASGLPDFKSIPTATNGRKAGIHGPEPADGRFPRLGWVERNARDGGKIVGFSYK